MTCSVFWRVVSTAAVSIFGLMLVCGLPGCGGEADAKKGPQVNASGKVEFDGQPVPAGTVTFLHHVTGNTAICNIYNGTYENESGQGPNPGKNVVMIQGKLTADGNPMWAKAWTKQVQVGETDFTEDFSIKSSEVKPFDPSKIQVDN